MCPHALDAKLTHALTILAVGYLITPDADEQFAHLVCGALSTEAEQRTHGLYPPPGHTCPGTY
ncbi:hypothetical protein OG729_13640 [Streptomyces sp. NBC_00210]|uniref:hypothetical protein n=1 Tax=Streptomyces sp. NBC_00210 TaxID=2903636 RepID=UPI003247801B